MIQGTLKQNSPKLWRVGVQLRKTIDMGEMQVTNNSVRTIIKTSAKQINATEE